jgi:pimeloyl-ACP methyl ester carboxylesterase
MRRFLVPLVPLLLVLAGCSAGPSHPAGAPSPAAPQAGTNCPDAAAKGKQAHFATPAGTQLVGVDLGTGTTGVVLAHQNLSDLCEWMLYGPRLVRLGYRILAFDFAGDGDSGAHQGDDRIDDDVVAAATYLRATGTARVVLMGASKGGTAALSAAVALNPPPVGVITLSAPALFGGVSAEDAVPHLACPALFLAAEYDEPFAGAAQRFAAAAPKEQPHQVFVAIGTEHGTALLAGGESKRVGDLIEAFLKQYG